jgi:hypothetical protein
MSVLTRFKSNEKLQAEALDVLDELISRRLLVVNVPIVMPFSSLECRPTDAYVSGSRPLAGTDLFRAQIAGEMPETNKSVGPGISLALREQFRFGSPVEEQQASRALEEALQKPGRNSPTTIKLLTSLATQTKRANNVLPIGYGIFLAFSAAYFAGTVLNTMTAAFNFRSPIVAWIAAIAAFCGTIFFLDRLNERRTIVQ